MKIRYTYKAYKGNPAATEISRSREKARSFYGLALGWLIIFCIIALVADFGATWYIAIPVLLLCIAGFAYLFTHYQTVTDRKIAKAIVEQNKIIQKKISEEYICLYIYRLDNYKRGRCEKCSSVSDNLRECLVKDRKGDGDVFLCNSCITRYMQNQR